MEYDKIPSYLPPEVYPLRIESDISIRNALDKAHLQLFEQVVPQLLDSEHLKANKKDVEVLELLEKVVYEVKTKTGTNSHHDSSNQPVATIVDDKEVYFEGDEILIPFIGANVTVTFVDIYEGSDIPIPGIIIKADYAEQLGSMRLYDEFLNSMVVTVKSKFPSMVGKKGLDSITIDYICNYEGQKSQQNAMNFVLTPPNLSKTELSEYMKGYPAVLRNRREVSVDLPEGAEVGAPILVTTEFVPREDPTIKRQFTWEFTNLGDFEINSKHVNLLQVTGNSYKDRER